MGLLSEGRLFQGGRAFGVGGGNHRWRCDHYGTCGRCLRESRQTGPCYRALSRSAQKSDGERSGQAHPRKDPTAGEKGLNLRWRRRTPICPRSPNILLATILVVLAGCTTTTVQTIPTE